MAKYTTNYVNLIADNLRDRYKRGFPILKELVQNADDAGAGSLVFGHHSGFAETEVAHPLLRGPALWVFNDGAFEPKDKQSIQSFGLNAKAADDGAIGKFGLGMKSVFHLCEGFFYMAFDGCEQHCEILSPWFGDENVSDLHQRWERIDDADRDSLLSIARDQDEARSARTWFMLWIPLRRRNHLAELNGKKLPGIIDRFPGDGASDDLDFLSDADVGQRLGLLLPLLRHVHTARFAGTAGAPAFRVQLRLDGGGARRLDHRSDGLRCVGTVADENPKLEHLHFFVSQRATTREPFETLRGSDSWPKSIAIVDSGVWGSVPDKTHSEGAVMFAHADGRIGRLVLQWAVFLPTEELRLTYVAQIPNSAREYRIVLHGQFFVDAGRRGIAEYERLAVARDALQSNASQQLVLQSWNQALAQELVLPVFLPALDAYARANGLRDDELSALTGAISKCCVEGESAVMGFFNAFSRYVCQEAAWVRTLSADGPAWNMVQLSRTRLLPLPNPATRDHRRPWRALPGLARLIDVVFIDEGAPALAPALSNWDEASLLAVLEDIPIETLTSETSLAYLTEFLEMERGRYVGTSQVQDALVRFLRKGLRQLDLSVLRGNRSHFQTLVSFLHPARRLAIGPQGAAAKGAIPEALYRALVSVESDALLLPKDLGATSGSVTMPPSEHDVSKWLAAIHREVESLEQSATAEADSVEPLLRAAEFIIAALESDPMQVAFMLRHRALRVLRATNARNRGVVAVSLESLLRIHQNRMLFKNANAVDRFGGLPEFAAALPDAMPLVVEPAVVTYVQSDIESNDWHVPASSDIGAMLFAIGALNAPPTLAATNTRRAFVKLGTAADLAVVEAARAMRYMLHASPDHFFSDQPLWLEPGGVESPWVKLWRMVDADIWNVLPRALSDLIPGALWPTLKLRNVDEDTVTGRLRHTTNYASVKAESFSGADRNLILARVKDELVWKSLPLHLDTTGAFGSISGECYLENRPEPPECIARSVRLIVKSDSAEHRQNQMRWLREWSAVAAVDLVLSTPRPEEHWRYILDQMSSPSWPTRPALPMLLAKPWLPLHAGGFIAPDSVIRIAGLEADIASLSRKCEFAYAGVDSLADEVRSSAGFHRLLDLLAQDEAALPTLAQLMAAAGLSVGRCALAAPEVFIDHVALLAKLACLPAWLIIERALVHIDRGAIISELIKGVATQLPLSAAEAALAEIRTLGVEKAAIDFFLRYLGEWRNCSAPLEALKAALPSMHLLAKNGHWALAHTLAADVFGVEPARVLDDRQLGVLSGVIVRNIGASLEDAQLPTSEPTSYDQDALLTGLKKLVDPFSSTSAPGAVGALLGLMGPAARSMAEEWLRPLAFDDYVNFLGWKDPGFEDGWERRRRMMGGMTPQQALEAVKPVVRFADGGKVAVKSVTGVPLELTLLPDDQAETFLAGELRWQVNYGVVVTFRRIEDLALRGVDDVKRLLQQTAEHLLKYVFNQPHANLDALWASFAKADQITLSVARQLVLEGLQNSLQQLPKVRRHPAIEAALGRIERARRERASAGEFGRRGGSADDEYRAAIKALGEVVASENDVQEVILAGIRERISDNQYEISSIPFELFQNADDAVSEFQQLQAADGRARVDANSIGRFVFERTDGVARFLHWGRPVNYTGRGDNLRPEFGSDLERMLMLGATAKSDAEGVTGKFGLGFKSVLLATDAPCVWSGDLCFRIVGGCLPERWTPTSQTRSSQAQHQGADKSLRTTLTELVVRDQAAQSELGDRFASLAGLLPVFAREICDVIVDDDIHHWSPKVIIEDGTCNVSVGMCRLPVQGGFVTSRVLVFKSALGTMVLRLTSEGVADFERVERHPIPAIWVTAPTRGAAARGFLLNAPFQIDTGRASLASGNAARRNNQQAEELARAVGAGVVALLRSSQRDWAGCAADLGCGGLQSAAEFWTGFWRAVGVSELPDAPSEDTRLLHAFALELFMSVLGATGEMPNGFSEADAAFAKISALRMSVDVTRRRAVLLEISKWPKFERAFPKSTWCTSEVTAWLECARSSEQFELRVFGRSTVFELLPEMRMAPEDIEYVAAVIDQWQQGPMEDFGWRTDFDRVQFRAEDGSWHPRRLLLFGGANADEKSSFAPQGAKLSSEYWTEPKAWNMVRPYLPEASFDPGTVAEWILAANELETQQAAVRWILHNLYTPTVHYLVSRRHDAGWLSELTRESEALSEFDGPHRTILLTRFGLGASSGELPMESLEDFPSLHAIHAWWTQEQHARLRKYDEQLWPAHADRKALLSDPYYRPAWMTLFSLGLMRRIGRATDAQNRGFLEHLHARGWWATICEGSPELNPEGWMNILQEYGEIQDDSPLFEQWMDLFPRLYRIARWLDIYVHIFTTVDLREPDQIRGLLAPAADASLSGSGIDAPTLRGMLRLGQHLIIRELLRVGLLGGEVAKTMAYAPTESLCYMMESLGYDRPASSQEIYEVLVDELGEEAAHFDGAFDIPLQLVASDASLRGRVRELGVERAMNEIEA